MDSDPTRESTVFEEHAQHGARREALPDSPGGARRALCAPEEHAQNRARRTLCAFEYFLYAAVIAETGLAALIYKIIFGDPDLARLRLYFAIFYFAFLAWTIQQLHKLHRDRANSPALPAEKPTAADTRPMLGLTGRQFAIVVVVFATAVAAFSWALRLLL